MAPVIAPCYVCIHERYNDTIFNMIKNKKALAADAFLEDTHVLNDGIRELARDHKKSQKSNSQKKKSIVELLQK